MGRIAAMGLGAAGLAAVCLLAAPAAAGQDDALLTVAPGDEIGIACDALEYSAPDNDVRVVLTISAAPSADPQPGFRKVLATNEELGHGSVHVRIPDVPDLADRTVQIDVYVVTATGARNCDAGHMRIANGVNGVPPQYHLGKQS